MKGLSKANMIRLYTLNISSGRAGDLEAALWALKQGNAGVGVLQDMNLMDRIHAWQGEGYSVWAT